MAKGDVMLVSKRPLKGRKKTPLKLTQERCTEIEEKLCELFFNEKQSTKEKYLYKILLRG